MRNALLLILPFLMAIGMLSCNDSEIEEGFRKVEFVEPLKCTTSNLPKEKVSKRLGTVVVYQDKELIKDAVSVYFEDKDQYYRVCELPEQYRKDGLIIMFSGTIYYPDPTVNIYDPLKGLDFEITDLWIKD